MTVEINQIEQTPKGSRHVRQSASYNFKEVEWWTGPHRTREGVRSAACGPAHPVDGSRPHSRARRIFLNGESIGARRCARLLACSCAHPLPIASNRYTLFAAVLRPPSVRCLQPRRQLGWPLRSSVCSCRYDVHACMLCTGCGARVHGLRPNVCCLCRCSLRRFTPGMHFCACVCVCRLGLWGQRPASARSAPWRICAREVCWRRDVGWRIAFRSTSGARPEHARSTRGAPF